MLTFDIDESMVRQLRNAKNGALKNVDCLNSLLQNKSQLQIQLYTFHKQAIRLKQVEKHLKQQTLQLQKTRKQLEVDNQSTRASKNTVILLQNALTNLENEQLRLEEFYHYLKILQKDQGILKMKLEEYSQLKDKLSKQILEERARNQRLAQMAIMKSEYIAKLKQHSFVLQQSNDNDLKMSQLIGDCIRTENVEIKKLDKQNQKIALKIFEHKKRSEKNNQDSQKIHQKILKETKNKAELQQQLSIMKKKLAKLQGQRRKYSLLVAEKNQLVRRRKSFKQELIGKLTTFQHNYRSHSLNWRKMLEEK